MKAKGILPNNIKNHKAQKGYRVESLRSLSTIRLDPSQRESQTETFVGFAVNASAPFKKKDQA